MARLDYGLSVEAQEEDVVASKKTLFQKYHDHDDHDDDFKDKAH